MPQAIRAAAISRTFERQLVGVDIDRTARGGRRGRTGIRPRPASAPSAGSRRANCRGGDCRSAGCRKRRASLFARCLLARSPPHQDLQVVAARRRRSGSRRRRRPQRRRRRAPPAPCSAPSRRPLSQGSSNWSKAKIATPISDRGDSQPRDPALELRVRAEMSALRSVAIEQPDVDGRGQRGRERRADMPVGRAAGSGRGCRTRFTPTDMDRVAHRRLRVVPRIISRGSAPSRGRRRAGRSRIAASAQRAFDRVGRVEMAVLEQRRGRSAPRRRSGRPSPAASGTVPARCPRFCVSIAFSSSPALSRRRDGRQEDGAQADADQPERKLVQPVGVIDVCDRAVPQQVAGKRGRDDQVELNCARADRRRAGSASSAG